MEMGQGLKGCGLSRCALGWGVVLRVQGLASIGCGLGAGKGLGRVGLSQWSLDWVWSGQDMVYPPNPPVPPQVIEYTSARDLETFSKFLDNGGKLPEEEPPEEASASFPVSASIPRFQASDMPSDGWLWD